MDLNTFTQKSQEAVQEAQSIGVRFGHQEVDVLHLLLALLQQDAGLVPRILERAEVPVDSLAIAVEDVLSNCFHSWCRPSQLPHISRQIATCQFRDRSQ